MTVRASCIPADDQLMDLATPGCTAKAITHRVAKFRDAAAKLGHGDGAAVSVTPKKRGRKADEEGDGDSVKSTSAKKPRTPKPKKSAAQVEDEAVIEEPVKKEVFDDKETKDAA